MIDVRAYTPPKGPQEIPPEEVGRLIDYLGEILGEPLKNVGVDEDHPHGLAGDTLSDLCKIAESYLIIKESKWVNPKERAETCGLLLSSLKIVKTNIRQARDMLERITSDSAFEWPLIISGSSLPEAEEMKKLLWNDEAALDELLTWAEGLSAEATTLSDGYNPGRSRNAAFDWLVAMLADLYERCTGKKATVSKSEIKSDAARMGRDGWKVGGSFVRFVKMFCASISISVGNNDRLGRKIQRSLGLYNLMKQRGLNKHEKWHRLLDGLPRRDG